MKVLVFENCRKPTGHRVPYARWIADAVASLGLQVVVAFPDAIQSSGPVETYFGDCDPEISTCFFKAEVAGTSFQQLTSLVDELSSVVDSVDPDYCLIPTGDSVAVSIGTKRLFRGRRQRLSQLPIDILLMRGEFVHKHVSIAKQVVKFAKWKLSCSYTWNRIGALDPLVWFSRKQCQPRLELCPDPVPRRPGIEKIEGRKQLGIPLQGELIVSCGNQNQIKGVDLLVCAFDRLTDNTDRFLVLVGPMSQEVRDSIDSNEISDRTRKQIIILDRFVTEEEFQSALLAADIVAVPYRETDRPSGIISRCVAWGIPIIASDHGWPLWACEQFDAGLACDTRCETAFAKGIETLLDTKEDFQQSDSAKLFAEFNTVENFQNFWTKGISEAMGQVSEFVPLNSRF